MRGKSREENRQIWLLRIHDLVESELSQREWCMKNGIPTSTLRYWIRGLREPEPQEPSNWLKVNVSSDLSIAKQEASPERSWKADPVRVHYGEFTLEIPDSCSRDRMFEILQVLKAL